MIKSWKTRLSWLISPMAIGFYITMVLVKLTVDYYQISTDHKDKNQTKGLTQLLYIAHQKSIDYRLQARGPRRVSPNLAMLTVDERAVATIGRWPWPRSIIARAVDNAFNYGAKVMAFDISFAESSVNPAQEVLAKAQSESLANPELETTLTQLSPLLDNDEALGAVFTKHADKIVAGSFSTATLDASWAPETEFCRDLIFKRTPVAQQWDREEILLSVADPTQAYMPASLSEIFGQVLSQREEEVRKTFGEPKSKNEQVRLENEVQAHLHEACDTILDDLREPMNEYWSTTILPQENPKEFT
ncbi:MAG: CHASE2 domain-containing protein, partial [Bdellovibrionales bacterium]